MGRLLNWLTNYFRRKKDPNTKQLRGYLELIVGIKPVNLSLYKLAFTHSSVSQAYDSNERLEFLGDAVLSLVVGEYLFKKYPLKQEGFLTDIRSRLVNRSSLNGLAQKIHIHKILHYDGSQVKGIGFRSIFGNALEALVGAIYLDLGHERCKKFIVDKLITEYTCLEELIAHDPNFKNQIIHWAQVHQRQPIFQLMDEPYRGDHKVFTIHLVVDGHTLGIGIAKNKKDAEQLAAKEALERIQSHRDVPPFSE